MTLSRPISTSERGTAGLGPYACIAQTGGGTPVPGVPVKVTGANGSPDARAFWASVFERARETPPWT